MQFELPETIARKEMVRWFHPAELLRSGFHAAFSSLIARYADRRETLAALRPPDPGTPGRAGDAHHSPIRPADNPDHWHFFEKDEVWIDFAADMGDGFDATYAVSALMGAKSLPVDGISGNALQDSLGPETGERMASAMHRGLPRADLLVLGGDLVYPFPGRDGYRDRLTTPMRAALPAIPRGEPGPSLFAIPGNHDWYDGLTSFVREFCQGGRIGGWRLWQGRSYFAVKLTGSWWLWGIDIALETRIDPAQLAYFRSIVEPEHRIILCTAVPEWYDGDAGYSNLQYFEDRIVRRAGASVALILTGDTHHYARYIRAPDPVADPVDPAGNGGPPDDDSTQIRITAGAGGSYLRGTHLLPQRLTLEEWIPGAEPSAPRSERYRNADFVLSGSPYPDPARSRRLALRALAFPFMLRNTGWFCLILGAIYVGLAHALGLPDAVPADAGYAAGLRSLFEHAAGQLRDLNRAALLMVALLVTSFGLYTSMANSTGSPRTRAVWGGLHGAAHAALAVAAAWPAYLLVGWIEPSPRLIAITELGLGILLAGLAAGLLFGCFLVLSDLLFGWHENEEFACQSIPDHRCFVRLRVHAAGIDIYPIGVDVVPRRWRRRLPALDRFEPADGKQDALLEPADGTPLRAHLIEGPIRIRTQPAVRAGP